jgi:hypothetical protein
VAGQLNQFQIVDIGQTGIDERFHQSPRFSHATAQKNGHPRFDMRQGLPGRNNPIFPLGIISSAHHLFFLLGFGSDREMPIKSFSSIFMKNLGIKKPAICN